MKNFDPDEVYELERIRAKAILDETEERDKKKADEERIKKEKQKKTTMIKNVIIYGMIFGAMYMFYNMMKNWF